MNFRPIPLLLLFGPSGVGKSTLGAALSESQDWLYFDTDPYSNASSISSELASQWQALCDSSHFAKLSLEMRQQVIVESRHGLVLSFVSMASLTIEQIAAARESGISTVFLFGDEVNCLNSFIRRESESGRNLSEKHWMTYNKEIYTLCNQPTYEPHKILAFHNGLHRPVSELVAEVQVRCAS